VKVGERERTHRRVDSVKSLGILTDHYVLLLVNGLVCVAMKGRIVLGRYPEPVELTGHS
jgi:hypothetical protein